MTQQTRHDDELGPERFCTRCDEWWPDDAEFWYFQLRWAGTIMRTGRYEYVRRTDAVQRTCKACQRESVARYHAARRRATA